MTDLRNSQLASVAVEGGTASSLDASQMGAVAVAGNRAAAALEASQLFVIAVIANGKSFKPMGPVIGLGCWTPCGTLLFNGE
jgi:hypothetical protein